VKIKKIFYINVH